MRLGAFSFEWHRENGWRERNALLAHANLLLGSTGRIVIIKEMFIIGFQLLESNLNTK